MKIDDLELQELIHRYVRGTLPAEDAKRFEEMYFADDDIAALVEAEQLLVQNAAALSGDTATSETERGADDAGGLAKVARLYGYAAGILLIPVAAALFYSMSQVGEQRGIIAGLQDRVAAATQPAIITNTIRLSPVRSGGGDEPAFRFSLPKEPGTAVQLSLPLPSELRKHPPGQPLNLRMSRLVADSRPQILWTREERHKADLNFLQVILPAGSLEPGNYLLEIGLHREAEFYATLLFRFEIKG